MKIIILTAFMLPSLAMAYHDDADDLTNQVNPMEMGRPLPPAEPIPMEPIGSTYERIERQFRGPAVVVPVQPSTRGPSYIGNDQIRTPEVECYRSVATGAMICQPY